MRQLLNLYRDILSQGIRQSNRTGIDTLTLPGAMLKFDLRDGFPAVTTKKLFFNGVKGELIGFLEGSDSLARFKELGCNVWDANVNAPAWQNNPACLGADDMGRIYGQQWRDFRGVVNGQAKSVDQIAEALRMIRHTPDSRRIIVNAWNPVEINHACLPPCHTDFQFLPHVESKVLHMAFKMRSCDMFLGAPFNIASYALLLELFAAWTGYKAGTLTMFIADAHIYTNHVDQVIEQLKREPLPLPKIEIDFPVMVTERDIDTLIDALHPDDIRLVDYQHHPAIKGEMAV